MNSYRDSTKPSRQITPLDSLSNDEIEDALLLLRWIRSGIGSRYFPLGGYSASILSSLVAAGLVTTRLVDVDRRFRALEVVK